MLFCTRSNPQWKKWKKKKVNKWRLACFADERQRAIVGNVGQVCMKMTYSGGVLIRWWLQGVRLLRLLSHPPSPPPTPPHPVHRKATISSCSLLSWPVFSGLLVFWRDLSGSSSRPFPWFVFSCLLFWPILSALLFFWLIFILLVN